MEEPRVLDNHGNEKDMVLVRQTYGSDFARAPTDTLAGATHVYRLIELSEKEGWSNIDTLVRGEDSQPQACVTAAFYWPDASTLSRPGEWKRTKYHHSTDTRGIVGFALGHGGHIRRAVVAGSHAIWVSEPTMPSDLGDKMGMLAATNRRRLKSIFQLHPLGMIRLTIDSPPDGAVLSVTEISVTGTTEPGFTVTLTVNGRQVPSVVANRNGVYSFTRAPLQGGVNGLSAKASSPPGRPGVRSGYDGGPSLLGWRRMGAEAQGVGGGA